MQYITAYFSESGTPKTGLSPTLEVYDVANSSKIIDGEAMEELADGFYRYRFPGSLSKDYVTICDSVTLTGSERYAVAVISR